MRTLDEVRGDIDRIDLQIRELFQQRMDFSKEVILAKIHEQNYAINRPDREDDMMERLCQGLDDDKRSAYISVLRKVIGASKMNQYSILYGQVPGLFEKLVKKVDATRNSDVVIVQMNVLNRPNNIADILSVIGDYGFSVEDIKLVGYFNGRRSVCFQVSIGGDIIQIQMQKLLLQLSMESENFEIVEIM